MNTQSEIQDNRFLAKSTDYHGVLAERYQYPQLGFDIYRLSLPASSGELWMSQLEMEYAVFALLDVWLTRMPPNDKRDLDESWHAIVEAIEYSTGGAA